MKRFFISQKGNITFSVSLFIVLLLCLMLVFGIVVSKNVVNLILHEVKGDLYMINRNAIFSIQRDAMGEDIEKFYELSEITATRDKIKRLANGEGLIKSAKILNVFVLEEGEFDSITKKSVDNLTVHTEVKVKILPIIFKSILEEKYEVNIHEDYRIQKMDIH